MNRPGITALALTLPLTLSAVLPLAVVPAAAQDGDNGHDHARPARYVLDGGPGGSRFEGIGVSPDGRTFYVSEVTGGEIHRGDVRERDTEVWKPEGRHERFTARGITTDRQGRVYIAGGPNGIDNPGAPDLWVYDEDGGLLTKRQVDEDNAFLNDVAIGPDGAAYFTNSNEAQIFRVDREDGDWEVETWADADNIKTMEGFNLGGIVVAPDGESLLVAQGNAGILWRFDLDTAKATKVDTGDANLRNADGLVIRGRTLWVVRNFDHQIVTLRVDDDGTEARQVHQVTTDEDRVFTTAKIARGRLLLVDSHFDEEVAEPPYQVIARRPPR